MRAVPKYLYSKVESGPKPGEYIIRTVPPKCIGSISREDGNVRVHIEEWWDEAPADKRHEITLDMKNWFFFKHEQQK